MRCVLPVYLAALIAAAAYPSEAIPNFQSSKSSYFASNLWPSRPQELTRRNNINMNPNGSTFLWLLQDDYAGKTFFDRWDFFPYPDPTNGHVNYVNSSEAWRKGLVSVRDDGTVIMKADDTTWLDKGTYRDSVRIASKSLYNTGLFILDLNQAPWGCAVWPAFWTVGGNWPNNGEIDIIEGVHDNQHNQVAWHTAPGCKLDTKANFTGSISSSGGQNHTDCNALINSNSGCGITEWSRASYGPYFDSQGGGVFAMKWDENSIAIWSFYRAAVPQDIVDGSPNPSGWGYPSAVLESSQCNINQFFVDHSVTFDITFCGDWAGNSYATSGCPGTCEERLMDPSNFQNASWSINSLKVYRKQALNGWISSSANPMANTHWPLSLWAILFMMIWGTVLMC